MGSIKVQTKKKKGKEYRYFYYRISRRSRKKDGGDGKGQTIDKRIGDSLTGKYLEFWLWDGLPAVDFIEAMISYEMKQRAWILPGIKWEIDWQFKKGKAIAGKLKFRSSPNIDRECPTNVDARSKYPRSLRRWLQFCIDRIFDKNNSVSEIIEAIAYSLAKYKEQKKLLAQEESKYQQWRKDPDREWWDGNTRWRYHPNYGDKTLENIEICRHNIDYWMDSYQSKVSDLMEICPPGERKRFEAAVIRQTEKLSDSPNYIDRYLTK
jgi:hypothetical protein